jgi:hypothetical protein
VPPEIPLEKMQSELASFLSFSALEHPNAWLKSCLEQNSDWLVIPPERRRLRFAALSFWPQAILLAIEDTGRRGRRREQFALVWEAEDFVCLDWTNEPIYSAVQRHPLNLGDADLILYARFFFHWIRGGLGRFILVESPNEIPWTPNRSEAIVTFVSTRLQPVRLLSREGNKRAVLSASVIFKNALFLTKIRVTLTGGADITNDGGAIESAISGTLELFDEQEVRYELPIRIDPPPGPFG